VAIPDLAGRRAAMLRARRVTILVLAIAALGLTDLALTLAHMRTTGLFEANPIARFMIEIGGERQLILFKLFSLALSGGVLYLFRTRRCAELSAWTCTAVLIVLTLYWAVYDGELSDMAHLLPPETASLDPNWVFLGE